MSRRQRADLTQAAWIFMATGVLALGIVGAVVYLTRGFAPLRAYPEQTVLSRVDGVEGPATIVGTSVIISGTKCVTPERDVPVTGSFAWVRDDGETRRVVAGATGSSVRRAGCETFRYDNPLPDDVTPGVWHIEGYEQAVDGSRIQIKSYRSERFRVVQP